MRYIKGNVNPGRRLKYFTSLAVFQRGFGDIVNRVKILVMSKNVQRTSLKIPIKQKKLSQVSLS